MTSQVRFAWVLPLAMVLGAACSAGQDKTSIIGFKGDSGTVTLPDGNVVQQDGAPLEDSGSPTQDSTVVGTDGGTPPSDSGWTTSPPTDSGVADTSPAVTWSLQITPANTTVTLPGGATSATLAFYASLVPSTGFQPPQDVTSSTSFTIDDTSIGTFSGTTLTYVKPGATTVRAKQGTYGASTSFTVVGPQVIVASGAPSGSASSFGGGGGGAAPTIVYPNDGTIVPPNMNVFEFQFLPGAGNTLFQLQFKGSNVDLTVYFPCNPIGSTGGCGYAPDATVWKYLAEGGRGQTPVTYTLSGVNGSTPGAVGASAAQHISFGLEDIVGGVYYWNAGAGSTMRYEFGVSGASAETWMNAPKAGAAICVGCHELSRRGHRVALGQDLPSPAVYKTWDVATRTVVFQGSTGANFYTFSPDETQMVTSDGATLTLRSASTGAQVAQIGQQGTQPNWSADGQHIVYAKHNGTCFGLTCGATGISDGTIQRLDWSGSIWASGPALVTYGGGYNNYYPTFSPDNSFVIFNRSPNNQNSYDAYDAEVWTVPTAGGTPVKLARASTGGDSWPKPTVEVQRYRNGGSLVWVTFSSRRRYGLRLNQNPPADPTKPTDLTAQIWMTAIDPAKAAAGVDGSWPAFWLPFQDLGSGNHIAQWVKKVERLGCLNNANCARGEQCVSGVCVGSIQ